jgi:hypothetical protein
MTDAIEDDVGSANPEYCASIAFAQTPDPRIFDHLGYERKSLGWCLGNHLERL